jgi:hypothetical protein
MQVLDPWLAPSNQGRKWFAGGNEILRFTICVPTASIRLSKVLRALAELIAVESHEGD